MRRDYGETMGVNGYYAIIDNGIPILAFFFNVCFSDFFLTPGDNFPSIQTHVFPDSLHTQFRAVNFIQIF